MAIAYRPNLKTCTVDEVKVLNGQYLRICASEQMQNEIDLYPTYARAYRVLVNCANARIVEAEQEVRAAQQFANRVAQAAPKTPGK